MRNVLFLPLAATTVNVVCIVGRTGSVERLTSGPVRGSGCNSPGLLGVPGRDPRHPTRSKHDRLSYWPCVTVSVWPAMVTVPLRGWSAELGEIEYATVPLPVPGLPDAIETKPLLLAAIQGQPGDVVTVIVPLPPAESNCRLEGVME